MRFRPATEDDLPRLKAMYARLVDHMNQNGVAIWNEYYPCEVLAGDISAHELYVLTDGDSIAAAFALCPANDGADHVTWRDDRAPARYLNRLGVNVEYLRQGVGAAMLRHAMQTARELGAEYLRLFVVDVNRPAISLYRRMGFEQAAGVLEEHFEDFGLREFGFEIKL